ncbi:MAG: carbon-nitrogen hydrolase family protein, partial [Clostridia bacterium]|nr:carbon-nitrogen hydrolase family protein [Clostridia bacterium]
MKVCVLQAPYSSATEDADSLFAYNMACLEKISSADVVVLPEYSDVPVAAETEEETLALHDKYFDTLMKKCKETAKRLSALVFVNALDKVGAEYRNTTFAVDETGSVIGKYEKRHIPILEKTPHIGVAYTRKREDVYLLTHKGVRYAFLTCYDLYFYEAFSRIAAEEPDVIVCCSLQRSDPHDVSELLCRFLAYNTGAYVIRSSVSFAEDSEVCGASLVATPRGQTLFNQKGKFGLAYAEFDPKAKFLKSAGYGRAKAIHSSYIEMGRNPWQYRPAGSSVIPFACDLPYPRVCAPGGSWGEA